MEASSSSDSTEPEPNYVRWRKDFEEFVNDEKGYELFKEYLTEGNIEHILIFRSTINGFRTILQQNGNELENVESGESIIKSIYKKYFRHKNLDLKEKFVDDSVLAQIENDYRKRPLNQNMYDEAFRHATTYLRPCYQNFFKSDIFINYVQSLSSKKEDQEEIENYNLQESNITNSSVLEEATSKTFENKRSTNSEILECGVCNNYFGSQGDRIPRLLSCGHTFCHSCLDRLCQKQNYLSQQQNLSNSYNNGINQQTTEIFCPFDRQQTELGPNGISDLKRNFALLDLIGNSRDNSAKIFPHDKSIQIPLDSYRNNNLPKISENSKFELPEAKQQVIENDFKVDGGGGGVPEKNSKIVQIITTESSKTEVKENEFKVGGETIHLNPYINMDENTNPANNITPKYKNSAKSIENSRPPPVKAISTLNYIAEQDATRSNSSTLNRATAMRNKKSNNDMISKNFGFLGKPSTGTVPNPYHARSSTINPVTRQGSAFHSMCTDTSDAYSSFSDAHDMIRNQKREYRTERRQIKSSAQKNKESSNSLRPMKNPTDDSTNAYWTKAAEKDPKKFADYLILKLKSHIKKHEDAEKFNSYLRRSYSERMSNPSYSVMGDDPGDDDDSILDDHADQVFNKDSHEHEAEEKFMPIVRSSSGMMRRQESQADGHSSVSHLSSTSSNRMLAHQFQTMNMNGYGTSTRMPANSGGWPNQQSKQKSTHNYIQSQNYQPSAAAAQNSFWNTPHQQYQTLPNLSRNYNNANHWNPGSQQQQSQQNHPQQHRSSNTNVSNNGNNPSHVKVKVIDGDDLPMVISLPNLPRITLSDLKRQLPSNYKSYNARYYVASVQNNERCWLGITEDDQELPLNNGMIEVKLMK